MRCKNCGICCNYICLEIDTPKTKKEFDEIRWYLAHKNIWIFIDDDGWNLQANNPCKYRKNGMCSNYKNRSCICRNYSPNYCEQNAGDNAFSHLFKNIKEFDNYLIENKKIDSKKRSNNKKG